VSVREEDHRVIPDGVALAKLRRAKKGTHLALREVVAQSPVRCHADNVPEALGSSTPAGGEEEGSEVLSSRLRRVLPGAAVTASF
jgi:hypothetical protein